MFIVAQSMSSSEWLSIIARSELGSDLDCSVINARSELSSKFDCYEVKILSHCIDAQFEMILSLNSKVDFQRKWSKFFGNVAREIYVTYFEFWDNNINMVEWVSGQTEYPCN